jgi:hypothetical protein
MPKSKKENNVKDWYNIMPKSFKTEYQNPSYDKAFVSHPFRMLIVAQSGGGKTTVATDIIYRLQNTFNKIVLCIKHADEPLYNFLRSKIKPEYVDIYEDGRVPPVRDYANHDGQMLIIFDDLVNEGRKTQDAIKEWYIRGRKACKDNQGASMMYLTQSYFAVPKTVRIQANYIILKKLNSSKDLTMILRDFSLGLEKEELLEIYKFCTDEFTSFLLIDIDVPAEKRFRKGYFHILAIPENDE